MTRFLLAAALAAGSLLSAAPAHACTIDACVEHACSEVGKDCSNLVCFETPEISYCWN